MCWACRIFLGSLGHFLDIFCLFRATFADICALTCSPSGRISGRCLVFDACLKAAQVTNGQCVGQTFAAPCRREPPPQDWGFPLHLWREWACDYCVTYSVNELRVSVTISDFFHCLRAETHVLKNSFIGNSAVLEYSICDQLFHNNVSNHDFNFAHWPYGIDPHTSLFLLSFGKSFIAQFHQTSFHPNTVVSRVPRAYFSESQTISLLSLCLFYFTFFPHFIFWYAALLQIKNAAACSHSTSVTIMWRPWLYFSGS